MAEKRAERETDVLVIGTGLAGLRAAIEARRSGQRVLLVDKSLIGINNNTALAGGGFKAALPGFLDTSVEKQYDTPDQHFRDTVIYGEYVCDQPLVETLSLEAPARILELQEFNIPHFEALCTYGLRKPMILADGSATVDANPARGGQAVTLALAEECKRLGVKTIDGCILLALLAGPEGIAGALLYRIFGGTFITCRARAVVLATGGAGKCSASTIAPMLRRATAMPPPIASAPTRGNGIHPVLAAHHDGAGPAHVVPAAVRGAAAFGLSQHARRAVPRRHPHQER